MKFFSLLKKEIRELLNAQTIIGMVISMAIMLGMGQIMGGVMDDAFTAPESISLTDNDNTDFTKDIIKALEADGNTVKLMEYSGDSPAEFMKANELEALIVIPEGFTNTVLTEKKPASLQCINTIESTSMMGSIGGAKTEEALSLIIDATTNTLLTGGYGISAADIETIKNPVHIEDITVAGDRSAKISPMAIMSFSTTQGMIVPMVIFILAMMASQMIISAISTEKIDKTLETLLTAPVSRLTVLGAKMTAATIVALLNAIVYMIGFGGMMTSMSGNMATGMTGSADLEQAAAMTKALSDLGMILSPGNYVMLGLQMFMTLLIVLSISLCLGAMATDAKSTQTVIMPMMFAIMIPFMLNMFTSINGMSTVPKLIMYLIPFTHTYTAIDNLVFGNMGLFWGGFAYQVVFFIVCMFVAVKLFTSDKLFTASLSFRKKKNATTADK